ncbi:xanthine dehydrogenase family protein molybdopterin-binding subunit [Pseudemcibacter aquimaris]|uniref:xanthine dehydrogenase family protein molybdopterin-binding subunit n=1 Tax=Pseudemcibacter aquimaris TaxID=2857064 RepID=UPI002010DDD2|nr:molybdopterin cofactor-binding domain-containing protein [Pseudemcibacter aquimaris]MCC3861987.1 molybdopterin-dependent oxidoreductase [Pseudemcibacter aquimaris]WDU58739.1 molybdopterin-dependent oxidoreductase [Pseudemcibacter aquimaris]
MDISRRSFLKATVTTTGSLLVYAHIGAHANPKGRDANPMPIIEMAPNGDITFISPRSDMGQGSLTSLAQIVLDEMNADWDKLVATKEATASSADVYGDDLVTVGAISMFEGWRTYRKAGASMREGFKLAASGLWQVDVNRLTTDKSKVIDPENGKIFHYHELINSLTGLYLPNDPEYKTKEQSNLIGKPFPQLFPNKRVTGEAIYGMDIHFPGLKVAMVERCPTFGGTLKSFNSEDAMKIKGVLSVVEIYNGVAVIAEGFWAAKKGRDALIIEWDHGELKDTSSASLKQMLKRNLDEPPVDKNPEPGEAKTVLQQEGGKKLTGEFDFPLVAHVTMEPMNTTAWVTDDKCEIWSPTQSMIIAQEEVAKLLNRQTKDITFHRTLCGGGFGRRAQEDFVLEAVDASRKSGYPVKLIWTREDDMRHDYYRSCSTMKIEAKMDDDGKLLAWDADLSFINTNPYHFIPENRGTRRGNGIGLAGIDPAYNIPNRYLEFGMLDLPITVGILRGISHGYTNFSIEVMIERLAKIANRDPLELRAELLVENRRAHTVITELQKLNSENPVTEGMSRGFAFAYEGRPVIDYQYYSAHMADVRKLDDGQIKVHKIWVVADHGRIINPHGFKKQINGSIYFALSMMRSGEITVKNGQIEQGNFDDYPVSLIGEGPEKIHIKLLDNGAHPMGCGEKMQAGIQPAIANAIEKLTDEEVNGIPIKNLA